jgi:hypothetical protein
LATFADFVEVMMIDFDEEIKKFKPSLEVEDAEEAIYNNNVPDIADLINKMMQDASGSNTRE